jgi:hypothetical protein
MTERMWLGWENRRGQAVPRLLFAGQTAPLPTIWMREISDREREELEAIAGRDRLLDALARKYPPPPEVLRALQEPAT